MLYAAFVASGLALMSGCSDGAKKNEPKLPADAKENPKLKPAESGSGTPGAASQGNKAQQAVTGD